MGYSDSIPTADRGRRLNGSGRCIECNNPNHDEGIECPWFPWCSEECYRLARPDVPSPQNFLSYDIG